MNIIFLLAIVCGVVALPSNVYLEVTKEFDLIKPVAVEPINPVKTKGLPGSRIIGGQQVEPNSVPYQAALMINGYSLCGGSLISTTHVLTAAHCTMSASFVEVRLGAHVYSQNEATQVRITSVNIKNHEEFDLDTISNDISILLLPSEAPVNVNIQVVSLPPVDAESYDGSNAFVSGWGITSDLSTAPAPALMGLDVQVISNDLCRSFYGSYVRDSVICTSGVGTVGVCTGDSGGPLVVDGVQVGVVSFSSSSCESGSPSGYMRVSYFRPWIQENAGI